MPKVTAPVKCAKCSSEKLRHEGVSMSGKYRMGIVRFDVYICEECGYSEFYSNG